MVDQIIKWKLYFWNTLYDSGITTINISEINYFFSGLVELIGSDVAYVNSVIEGSLAKRNLAEGRTGEEWERSKKHRIACYRAGVSKCSKYAPNARLRGPNHPMQITERPAFV